MKTIKIKSVSSGSSVGISLARPGAKTGAADILHAVEIYEVRGVPDDTSSNEVLTAFRATGILLGHDAPPEDYRVAWAELGPGRIVRRGPYRIYDSESAAAELGVSVRRVLALAANRGIPRRGNAWIFTPDDLETMRPGPGGRPPKTKAPRNDKNK